MFKLLFSETLETSEKNKFVTVHIEEKEKTQRKSSTNESNCSCANSSMTESHVPWRISNFIYENQNSRFSLPQIPSEKPSCPSMSADESFISHNRSIVNFTDNIFQDTEILSPIPCESFPPRLSVATSTPTRKSQRFKVSSTEPFHLISDAELFSLATCSDDESSEADVISLPPDDSLTPVQLEKCKSLLSNEELFSLAMEINNCTEGKSAENCSASGISDNESISFNLHLKPATRKNFMTLMNNETISQALSNLELHSLNQDFTNLVTCLANGSINPTDQPILSALDFAHFRNLKDT